MSIYSLRNACSFLMCVDLVVIIWWMSLYQQMIEPQVLEESTYYIVIMS